MEKRNNERTFIGGGIMAGSSGPIHEGTVPEDERSSCFCFESDDDSTEKIRLRYTKRKLMRGCISNMTICLVLVGYTFLGAIIFLAIEGGSVLNAWSQKNVGPTFASVSPRFNGSSWLERLVEEPRARTVESIWEITVSLNILYKDNWTRLASMELTKFQETLVERIREEMSYPTPPTYELKQAKKVEWTLARAFLYSLTILTTIGYGNLVPKTGLGKAVTMGYAAIGIPLVLLYLSSVGSLLSSCARNIFTKSLCCCLCSNCGYCCYDEKRMQEKEKRMRKKRERREYEQRMQPSLHTGQEPFYVRSASAYTASTTNNFLISLDDKVPSRSASILDTECLSNDTSFVDLKSGAHFLAPLLLCLTVMVIYIGAGAFILFKLEESWSYFESIFFCFMVLSTIGFGDSVSNDTTRIGQIEYNNPSDEMTVWFCSLYILCGLALTSMCFNVVHEEIVHKIKHNYIIVNNISGSKENSVNSFKLTNTAAFTEEPSSNDYLTS